MRTYVGDRLENGPARVRIIDPPDRPPLSEINDVLAELNFLTFNRDGSPELQARRQQYMARKDDLVRRILEAENHQESRDLPHVDGGSPDGFEWGYVGNGPRDLAAAILRNELAVEPTPAVCCTFCRDVVARLPRTRFELPASEVTAWIQANRKLIDREQFLEPDQPSHAVAASLDDRPRGLGTGEPAAEPGEATASALVAACEAAWDDIRAHHPELPDAVVILGTGVERGRLIKLGHWWGHRWVADGQSRGEVLIAGEALHLPPRDVFEVLLHEAVHGINASRAVRDTSRNGRYHNQRFADTAREVLLEATAMPPYGLASTRLTPAAEERYGPTIESLGEAMRIARQLDKATTERTGEVDAGKAGDGGGTRKSQATAASCGCGRRIRMAPTVLAAGPVVCGLCGSEFSTGAERSSDPTTGMRREPLTAEGLDPALLRAMSHRRDQLDGAIRNAAADRTLAAALTERRDRIDDLLQRAIPPADPEGPTAADPVHDAVRLWYETFGTHDEHPIPASDPFQLARHQALARDLLKVDGTLHGPAVTIGRTELMAGDRIVATAEDRRSGLPEGVPGTVTAVNPGLQTIDLDFDTWGTLRTSTGGPVARSLRHAYAALEPEQPPPVSRSAAPELEPPGAEIEP